MQRTCKKCKVVKNLEDFTLAKECTYGRSHECKSCKTIRDKSYEIKNPNMRKEISKRFYKKHYTNVPRVYTEPTTLTRICTECKLEKTLDQFYLRSKSTKAVVPKCIACSYDKRHEIEQAEKNNTTAKRYYYKHQKEIREKDFIKKYGISYSDKINIYNKQNKLCKICNNFLEENETCLDHNHKTGKIRGVLCDGCNKGLGNFKDNVNFLYKAIEYLLDNDFNINNLLELEVNNVNNS